MKIATLMAVSSLALAAFASTASAEVYAWSFVADNGDTAQGVFTTDASNIIVSATGTVNLPTLDANYLNTSVTLAGLTDGAYHLTPSGGYSYDNLHPIDNPGLFLTAGGTSEFNLYSRDGGYPSVGLLTASNGVTDNAQFGVSDADHGSRVYSQELGTLTISATPEPAAWALMMIGVGGMGAALRTRRRTLAA